jgi:hypothetical protein
MSWRDAPLYVRCHDLARGVLERFTGDDPDPAAAVLVSRVCATSAELLCAVSLALTFRSTRAADLAEADRALVRLRVQLRLLRDLGGLSAGGLRHLDGSMTEIGRMIGGWRKRVEGKGRRAPRWGLDPADGEPTPRPAP